MPAEKSVGGVVFRNSGNGIEFLLLYHTAGHWGFPKGKVEQNETEQQTMLREIAEETSLTGLEQLPGFRQSIKYFFKRGNETISKEVVYYLLESKRGTVTISSEHKNSKWLPFKEAMRQFNFQNTKEVLLKANQFLKQKKQTISQ